MRRPPVALSILLLLATQPAQTSCQSRRQKTGGTPAAATTLPATTLADGRDTPGAFLRGDYLPPEIEESLTPLMRAAWDGDDGAVRDLLRGGVDVNEKNNMRLTALMLAAKRGHLATVKLLLEVGAKTDPNPRDGRRDEFTALWLALRPGNEEVVKTLLDAGSEVNPPSAGMSPLMYAITARAGEPTVKLLIERGADVSARMRDNGSTPLMAAAESGDAQVVRLLIDAGADVYARDKFGRTALALALENQSGETVRALRRAGAKK